MKQREIARLLLPTLGLFGITSLAHAQADLYTIDGAAPEDLAGSAMGAAGFYSADANADIIMGSPQNFIIFTAGNGRAAVHSGTDGSVLMSFLGDSIFDQFGAAVAGGFDFNNDGRDDVIIGAPFDSNLTGAGGMARVYSGATNGLLLQIDGTGTGDQLGSAVSGCGDVNNDGFDDVIVGSPGDDSVVSDGGSARVYSGNGGGLLWTVFGVGAGNQFGSAVCGMGDLNGDMMDEFAVGSAFGGVRIYNGATGAVMHTFPSTGSNDFYGLAIANAGDVDGDTINDIVIGATEDDILSPGAGFAEIRSGSTGALIRTLVGDNVADRFGLSVDGAGDMNGDDLAEVIVGADQSGTGSNGYARVHEGSDGSTVFDVTSADPSNALLLGTSVAGLGDVNGDFSLEVGVGAPLAGGSSGPNIARGEVRVVSGPDLSGCAGTSTYCVAGVNSSGTQALIGSLGTTSIAANDLILTVNGATPNTLGIFYYGPAQLNAIPINGTSSFRCVGAGGVSIYRLGASPTNSGGAALKLMDYNSGPANAGTGAITAGSTWNFAFFYRDTAEAAGMNFSNGLEAVFCP